MRAGAMVRAVVVAIVGFLGAAMPVSAQPAGTLVVGLVAEPVNLDPAQVTDINSNRVGRRIVETLVTFPDESTQVVPGLAAAWRQLPRRDAVQRRGGEVLHRAADRSRASGQ